MRAIVITMITCYLVVFIFGNFISNVIFSSGGGVTQSYIYPIYLGIIFLSGLIVGCTLYIVEQIKKK